MHGQYPDNIAGLLAAERAAYQVLSPRYRKLDKLERYVRGEQYEGMPDFYNPKADVPFLERAPNIVHSLVEAAIRQHVDFAFGEGRFPQITAAADDDERLLGEGMPDAEAQVYDAWLRLLMRHSCFVESCTDALANAEASGTAVSVVSLVDGVPRIDALRAKWCTPEFDPSGRKLLAIEVAYPYIAFERARDGTWLAKAYMYQRRIDEQADTVFEPAPLTGSPIAQRKADKAKSVQHGLGFCPVVWYRFRQSAQQASEHDGTAIHATQLDELDALNYSLSQRGRAAIYSGDPQVYEMGADQDNVPGGVGRAGIVIAKDGSGYFGTIGGGRPARKKGAGVVWTYENPDAKVGMLTLPGDALKGISDHVADVEDKIGEVLGYTKASPEHVKGAISGKALGFLFSRTTNFVDGVRADFWHGWMVPALDMLNRIVLHAEEAAAGSVYVPGIKRALPILRSFWASFAGGSRMWMPPRLRPTWGAYFKPTAQEEGETTRLTVDAYTAKIIPLQLALEKLRGVFPHDSSERLAEEMEHEHEEQAELEAEAMAKQNAAALGKPDAEDDEAESEDEGPPSTQPAPGKPEAEDE